MSLQEDLTNALKSAMKSKDQVALTALRAIKSSIILLKTQSSTAIEISREQELKLLQKLVKQRQDSASIYTQQKRQDLADSELAEAAVISQFLPEMLGVDEIKSIVEEVVNSIGASGMKDMGRVMGMVSKKLAGKADGKTIATVVKEQLQN